ncbi:MAG: leucyl/phenylalanyl-tRNA--protein transferase, partial [Sulfurovaceae bacterium]|nr:leucyl/phenylalanyl-tRNA--protein transferase [Sulfurovaceae bacterium]
MFTIDELGENYIFPNPRFASDEGLLAYGGDLSPNMLLSAYSKGIFPWFNETDPILWWSPNPRLILLPTNFKTSKSLLKTIKSGKFEIKFDHDFAGVIKNCAVTPRFGQNGTWITSQMQEAYLELFKMGFAHSVETYLDGKLVGGLYGIAMGKGFFGESMFSHVGDASKVAL